MYQKINEITDRLFQDIEMTEEAQALKEELTADLNERYADLLADGLSEDEAARRISEDLADFSELTGSFPHRRHDLMPVAPDAIPAGGVSVIRVRLGADDLQVIPSEDAMIHLSLTGDLKAQWHSWQDGNVLALEIVRPDEEGQAEEFPQTFTGWVKRALSTLASYSKLEFCRGVLRVPALLHAALEITTGSGNVDVDLPLDTLVIRTGSGDADVRLYESCRKAQLSAASGDITLRGSAAAISVSTASGDISLSSCSASALRISTTSGDAELAQSRAETLICKTTSGDLSFIGEAHEIDYKTVSGDIDLTLAGPLMRINGSAVSGDAKITLADRQPASVQVNSVSGSIQMNCQDGPRAAKLTLKSVSGDITVA